MKRTMLLVAVLLVVAGTVGVFASGDKEEPQQAPPAGPWGAPDYRGGPGYRGAPGPCCPPGAWGAPGAPEAPQFSEEKLSLTGELYFENRMHPELKSGGKEYELLVPHFYAYQLDLEEGATVTVEGYEVTGMPRYEKESDGEVHVWVTKAVIDGKEYDLQRGGPAAGGGWMGGPRGGMMGPGGRGGWGWMPHHNYGPYGRRW